MAAESRRTADMTSENDGLTWISIMKMGKERKPGKTRLLLQLKRRHENGDRRMTIVRRRETRGGIVSQNQTQTKAGRRQQQNIEQDILSDSHIGSDRSWGREKRMQSSGKAEIKGKDEIT
jgi:hypothetical protein